MLGLTQNAKGSYTTSNHEWKTWIRNLCYDYSGTRLRSIREPSSRIGFEGCGDLATHGKEHESYCILIGLQVKVLFQRSFWGYAGGPDFDGYPLAFKAKLLLPSLVLLGTNPGKTFLQTNARKL